MKCASYYRFFETISNKLRFDIILLLKKKQLSVSQICSELNEEQSKISHNLRLLLSCNIIDVKRSGKNRIYSLNHKTILPLLDILDKHVSLYCKNNCSKN